MILSRERITHCPDIRNGRMRCGRDLARVLRAEPDCTCGITERHEHCEGCGRVACIGDWAAPGIIIATIRLPAASRRIK